MNPIIGKMTEQSDSEEMQTAETEYKCILLCRTPCCASDSLDNITHAKWESIKNKSLLWKELDRFQDVGLHENVEWEKGPKGLFMHSSCYTTMSSKRSLFQAQKRKHASEENFDSESMPDERITTPEVSVFKKLRSSTGTLHNKNLCVWCMKGEHKKIDRSKKILSTVDAWNKFKLHTVNLQDENMRHRIDTLITSIPDSRTAFGLEIRYHRGCWRMYVSYQWPLSEDDTEHLQGVNLR